MNTPTNRIPAGSWIVCPDGHQIAKAERQVTIGSPRNWRAGLTEWAKGAASTGYACPSCGGYWLDARGGRGLVRYEPVERESSIIITESGK
jgi:hypothetical protein